MVEGELLAVENLRKVFAVRGRRRAKQELVAVEDLSFSIPVRGSLAIVGESGSGKTTAARCIVGLEVPSAGSIRFRGRELNHVSRRAADRRKRARALQIVFQDVYSSLDRRQSAARCIDELLRIHFVLDQVERDRRVAELGEMVGLDRRQMSARPGDLSGGQRQRIAIARALASEPELIILDEAVASLDVSIQAQVLNLLAEIRSQTGISYLLISHDLAVVRQLCEQTVVMHKGRVVERGSTAQVLDHPAEPYTQKLRASVPGG